MSIPHSRPTLKAIVSQFIGLIVISSHAFSQPLACFYSDKSQPDEVELNRCIMDIHQDNTQTDLILNPQVLHHARYDRQGLSVLRSEKGIYYFNRRGIVRQTIIYDNGADYFVEGYARTFHNGKMGYMDQQLRITIKPQFDFAFPFEHGRATVCNGCHQMQSGEHQSLEGGIWKIIDKQGNFVSEP